MNYQTNVDVVTTQSENTTIETTITTKTAVPEFGDEVIVRKKGEPSYKAMVEEYHGMAYVRCVWPDIRFGFQRGNFSFTNAKWNDEHARWEVEVNE